MREETKNGNYKRPDTIDLSIEVFILFIIGVFIVQNWIFLGKVSPIWTIVRIFYSILSLLLILLASTEWGFRFLKFCFGTKHIGLKFCSISTLLIGVYVLLGKLSFEGFYLLMGIKIAGDVHKYTPFAFVIIFAIFFMISSISDSANYSEKVKIADIVIVTILVLFVIATSFPVELESSFVSLLMHNLHPGIAAILFFPQFLCQWEYLNLPLVIFLIQRNYDRLLFGFTLRLTWSDFKTILIGILLLFGLTVVIGLASERVIYIPYDPLSFKLWWNKIYYALFIRSLTEEFIYRGLVLTITDKLLREKNYKNGSTVAILISTLFYAFSYWRAGVVHILMMILVGLVLSYGYYRTKKFAVPVLLNAFWVIISSEWSGIL